MKVKGKECEGQRLAADRQKVLVIVPSLAVKKLEEINIYLT